MAIELADKLYTSTQVADILGVSLRTLYRYMEDNKIKSMRTASGRHRFTKDHIIEFLNAGRDTMDSPVANNSYNNSPRNSGYSNVQQSQGNMRNTQGGAYFDNMQSGANNMPNQFGARTDFQQPNNPAAAGNRMYEQSDTMLGQNRSTSSMSQPFSSQPVSSEDDFEFDVTDYEAEAPRADVRPQNTSYEDDYATQSFAPQRPAYQGDRVEPAMQQQVSPIRQNYAETSFAPQQQQAPVAQEERRPDTFEMGSNLNIRYYKSEYSDLIELAKKIKDTANSKDLEYGFTLYAGLSLHYPINPFTTLNFYANPEDMQLWKDELKLVPATKREDANVGVIINTDIVFVPSKEIGSFRVVDDKVLLKDLSAVGEEELVKEFRQRLSSL